MRHMVGTNGAIVIRSLANRLQKRLGLKSPLKDEPRSEPDERHDDVAPTAERSPNANQDRIGLVEAAIDIGSGDD